MSRLNAAKAAQGLLERVWGSRGFPVDPARIATELGIDVITANLPDKVSGALVKARNADPMIALNCGTAAQGSVSPVRMSLGTTLIA